MLIGGIALIFTFVVVGFNSNGLYTVLLSSAVTCSGNKLEFITNMVFPLLASQQSRQCFSCNLSALIWKCSS